MADRNKKIVSPFLLLITSVIWGFAFVAQVDGMQFMGPFTYTGVRFALGAAALIPAILILERGPRQGEWRATLKYGAIIGLLLFAASNLQQIGIDITQSVGKAGFITGLYTVLVPVFSIAFGKKPTVLTGLGTVAAFAGLYFLSAPEGLRHVTLGDGVLMLCAVIWTFHIMAIDAFGPRVRPLRMSAVSFAVCAVLSLITMAIFEQPSLGGLHAGLAPLLYGGLLSVGLAYTLQVVGQPNVEPSKAAIIFSLESLFAALGGFLLKDELLGWKGYLGGGLMFLGILLSQMKIKKKQY